MTFSVKKYLADKQLTPFEFEDINGELRQLPNLMLMTAPQVDAIMAELDSDPAAALSRIAPEMADIIASTPLVALMPLATAYLDHCKQAVGEAAASRDSSESTARPSKRTSRATTRARTRKP